MGLTTTTEAKKLKASLLALGASSTAGVHMDMISGLYSIHLEPACEKSHTTPTPNPTSSPVTIDTPPTSKPHGATPTHTINTHSVTLPKNIPDHNLSHELEILKRDN